VTLPSGAPVDAAGVAADRLEELVQVATSAMRQAYAPYSNFRVGAALLTRSGDIFRGCNVENAAYPSGLCAERGAVMSAVAHGQRDLLLLALVTEAEEPTPPCGQCRQVLAEFAPALDIVSVGRAGVSRRWTMTDLLPSPFLPASLGGGGQGSRTKDL
jgi:cytidine deaminase